MTQDTINVILILISALSLIVGVVAVILLLKKGSAKPDFSEVYEKNAQQLSSLRQELSLSTQQSVKNMGDMIATFCTVTDGKLESHRRAFEDFLFGERAEARAYPKKRRAKAQLHSRG